MALVWWTWTNKPIFQNSVFIYKMEVYVPILSCSASSKHIVIIKVDNYLKKTLMFRFRPLFRNSFTTNLCHKIRVLLGYSQTLFYSKSHFSALIIILFTSLDFRVTFSYFQKNLSARWLITIEAFKKVLPKRLWRKFQELFWHSEL